MHNIVKYQYKLVEVQFPQCTHKCINRYLDFSDIHMWKILKMHDLVDTCFTHVLEAVSCQ